MPQRIAKQIHHIISEKDNFLLIPHQHPDGDAIGSSMAFSQMLDAMGKQYHIFCATKVDPQFSYIKNTDKISQDEHLWDKHYAAIIVFDSGDFAYAGIDQFIEKQPHATIINLDHHISNARFGDYKLVLDTLSSTCEIVYNYFACNGVHITRDMATSLLTGLITDTNNFSNAATSKNALAAASKLINKGAELKKIHTNILMDKTITVLKLWGVILERLALDTKTNIAYSYVHEHELRNSAISEEGQKNMLNFLSNLNEGKAVFLFKERGSQVKVSTRTTGEDIDLSKIARHFGGGGHQKASGFEVEGSLDTVIPQVWKEIEKIA